MLILATVTFISHTAIAKSTFSQEKLKKACENYIYKNVGEDAIVSLPKVISNQEFDENEVVANIVTNIDNLQGNITLKIEFRKNGTLLRYTEIPARIKLYRNVVVAEQTIISGEILDDRNLKIEKKEVTNFKEDLFYSINSLRGMKAKRNISKGNILSKALINIGSSVKRGDKVTLIVKSGAVSIRTSGVALQDAEEGNNLRVKREGYQGVFQGKFNSDGTVIINVD